MDVFKLLILLVICFSPALFEYRVVFESKSLAQVQGVVGSVKNVPSAALPIPGLVVTEVKYSYNLGGKNYPGEADSLPHIEYFTHIPNDINEDLKPMTPIQVSFKLSDPEHSISPRVGEVFAIIACVQGAFLTIALSLLGLVVSLATTTYR